MKLEEEYAPVSFGEKAPERRFFGLTSDLALIVLVLLVAVGSFGLGILAGRAWPSEGQGVWVENLSASALQAASTTKAASAAEAKPLSPPATSAATHAAAAPATGGQVVASKSGHSYYYPWCGSVSRIKDENKVYFASADEAIAKGYVAAKNCKGM